jgi:hypothetical protein
MIRDREIESVEAFLKIAILTQNRGLSCSQVLRGVDQEKNLSEPHLL